METWHIIVAKRGETEVIGLGAVDSKTTMQKRISGANFRTEWSKHEVIINARALR